MLNKEENDATEQDEKDQDEKQFDDNEENTEDTTEDEDENDVAKNEIEDEEDEKSASTLNNPLRIPTCFGGLRPRCEYFYAVNDSKMPIKNT